METQQQLKPFPLGTTFVTTGATRLNPDDLNRALTRHRHGDWGELDPEDAAENERSLKEGLRLLSTYTDREGTKFWIITEADRSSTTVMLPEDY